MTARLPLRAAGWCAILGSVMAGIGNGIHPVTPRDDPQGVAEVIAQHAAWTPIHLLIILGLVGMTVGLVFLAAVVASWSGCRALGLAAALTAVSGCTLGVLTVGLDGVAAKELADTWSVHPDAITLHGVTVNETLNFALAGLFNVAFAGAPFILLGIAFIRARSMASWQGWAALIPGMIAVVAGSYQMLTGHPTNLSLVLTIIGPTLITLWTFVIGTQVVRGTLDTTAPRNDRRAEGHRARPLSTSEEGASGRCEWAPTK